MYACTIILDHALHGLAEAARLALGEMMAIMCEAFVNVSGTHCNRNLSKPASSILGKLYEWEAADDDGHTFHSLFPTDKTTWHKLTSLEELL